MNLRHFSPPAFFLLQLLWLYASRNCAQNPFLGVTISSSQSPKASPSSTLYLSSSLLTGFSGPTGVRTDFESSRLSNGTGKKIWNGKGSSTGTVSTRLAIPPVGYSSSSRPTLSVSFDSPSFPSGTGARGKIMAMSSVGGTTLVKSVFQSKSGTASATKIHTSNATPLPGSTRIVSSAPATATTVALTATSKGQTISVITHIPGLKSLKGTTPTSITTLTGSIASSQESQYGSILIRFVNEGRSWGNDITLPAVKTQALQEVNDMRTDTERKIRNLGGDFPPLSNKCSHAGKRKRFFNPLETVENLAHDALGLANCIDNILNDILSEVGPLTGPPPPPDIIPEIKIQLNALEQAGKEADDNVSSTSNEQSSTGPSSTASSSSSSAPVCPIYSYPTDDIDLWEGTPDDSIGTQKRRTTKSKRDRRHVFAKRASGQAITAINSCNFPLGIQILQPKYSELKGFQNLGKQPGGNGGAAGQVFDNAPKWYVGNHSCGTLHGFNWYRTTNRGPKDIPSGSTQSVDHVYEKQLINLFLQSQIDIPSFTCKDMNTLFFPCNQNNMQNIFDQLPGMQLSAQGNTSMNIKPGFAGLEQSINAVKGYMFDKGLNPPSKYFEKGRLKSYQSKIQTIQDFIMLFGIIKDPDFQRMYDITNNRVYSAFAGIDNFISTNKLVRVNGTLMSSTWASNYKAWMTQYLVDIAPPAWNWAHTTHDDLETQINADTNIDPALKAALLGLLSKIKTAPGFSQADFTCGFGLTWQILPLSKGDFKGLDFYMKRDGTCSLNSQISPSSSQAVTSSALSSSDSVPTAVMTTLLAACNVPAGCTNVDKNGCAIECS